MKIALMMRDEWNKDEIKLLESLGEIVPPWTAGRDVTIAVSRLPGGTRFYAWSRVFTNRDAKWVLWADTLEELVEKIEEAQNETLRNRSNVTNVRG